METQINPKPLFKVVFTGPGPAVRADLAHTARKHGIVVQSSVMADTQILVASRTDTVKAKRAAERGITVLDYETFILLFLDGAVEKTGAEPDKFVDVSFTTSKMQLADGDVL